MGLGLGPIRSIRSLLVDRRVRVFWTAPPELTTAIDGGCTHRLRPAVLVNVSGRDRFRELLHCGRRCRSSDVPHGLGRRPSDITGASHRDEGLLHALTTAAPLGERGALGVLRATPGTRVGDTVPQHDRSLPNAAADGAFAALDVHGANAKAQARHPWNEGGDATTRDSGAPDLIPANERAEAPGYGPRRDGCREACRPEVAGVAGIAAVVGEPLSRVARASREAEREVEEEGLRPARSHRGGIPRGQRTSEEREGLRARRCDSSRRRRESPGGTSCRSGSSRRRTGRASRTGTCWGCPSR